MQNTQIIMLDESVWKISEKRTHCLGLGFMDVIQKIFDEKKENYKT